MAVVLFARCPLVRIDLQINRVATRAFRSPKNLDWRCGQYVLSMVKYARINWFAMGGDKILPAGVNITVEIITRVNK